MHLMAEKKFWYRRFRNAAYVTVLGWIVWTLAIVLPVAPFSYLPPIMIGGGPGTWFLLGYILYVTVGVGGFAGLSAFLFAIETYERRTLNETVMLIGFVLLYLGLNLGCILLGVAGAMGGYALTIEHNTVTSAQNILSVYVDPITAAVFVAAAGVVLSIYGMVTAAKASAA